MTSISRLADSIDSIVDTLNALDRDDFEVFYGPEIHDYLGDSVYIGWDANQLGNYRVANTDQDWASIGQKSRNETLDIVCSVVSTRGDNDTKAALHTAFDILGAVESGLRVDPSLGFGPPSVASVRPRETWYAYNADGLQVRVVFIISVKTRV